MGHAPSTASGTKTHLPPSRADVVTCCERYHGAILDISSAPDSSKTAPTQPKMALWDYLGAILELQIALWSYLDPILGS